MNVRIEKWNGNDIRFVEVSKNEWNAVAKDVAEALGYRDAHNMVRTVDPDELRTHKVSMGKTSRKMTTITELGIYEAIFGSDRPEAKDFKKWVMRTLKHFREASGLEGFQIFRMLDKEHQREMMSKLSRSLENPVRIDFIKANTIANKAVSQMFGHPKMLKKEQMTPQMIAERQSILDDTVTLMAAADKFGLELSVSEKIYAKYH